MRNRLPRQYSVASLYALRTYITHQEVSGTGSSLPIQRCCRAWPEWTLAARSDDRMSPLQDTSLGLGALYEIPLIICTKLPRVKAHGSAAADDLRSVHVNIL